MNTRWNDAELKEFLKVCCDLEEDLGVRLFSARLIGCDPNLVLHGGGNVSLKSDFVDGFGDTVRVIRVKASGGDLAYLSQDRLPALELDRLLRWRQLRELGDEEMVRAIRSALLNPEAPTPSIETLVHAWIPKRCVDHSHPDALLVLTNQENGKSLIAQALSSLNVHYAYLPYVFPGFPLAVACADALEADPELEALVLAHHGLLTFNDDIKCSYDTHLQIAGACEAFLKTKNPTSIALGEVDSSSPHLVSTMLELRKALAIEGADESHPWIAPICSVIWDKAFIQVLGSPSLRRSLQEAPLTTDHLIRTKTHPLILDLEALDKESRVRVIEAGVEEFRREYGAYIERHRNASHAKFDLSGVDLSPRVVMIPGMGVFCFGENKEQSQITADIMRQTIVAKAMGEPFGKYLPLSEDHLFDMEFRSLQLAKKAPNRIAPLEGKVVIISGAAGAIGVGIAEECAREGAHVVLTDLDADRLNLARERVEAITDKARVLSLIMDVTDEASVSEGFDRAIKEFGGIDVIVPNAGIAHVSPIESLELGAFKKVLDVNLVGYMLFMREGSRRLIEQRLGGHIVINASKNVFGPGKDFGAYSASKAGGHQLGKVAAIELAPHGIRVNMINADAVFGDESVPSGLWDVVGKERAQSRGMTEDELPDYYRDRNLLKIRVLAKHVGRAVVFFASSETPTTGGTLPVDGGVIEAFPR